MGFKLYPAKVENMVSSYYASRWQVGFYTYPANVENMVISQLCQQVADEI
jgi:hypothetical protein